MAEIDWESGQIGFPASAGDEIDWDAGEITEPPAPKGITGHARDLGLSALKSAIAVPETLVGLADIPTGGRVGKALENEGGLFGFRPKEAKQFLSDQHTDQYKAQQREFQEADGVLAKTGVALQNPSLIANTVMESAAPMLAGGVAARGLRALAPRMSAVAAGATGEGAVMAGAQAESIRQETDDGLLTSNQSGAAALTGVLGSLFSFGGASLAKRLGIGDVDTMLARGSLTRQDVAGELARMPAKSVPRQVVEGAITEGFLEELPQSISEQIIQNLALDRPWSDGVEDAAVMGTLAGMVMGGGASIASGVAGRQAEPQGNAATPVSPPPDPQASPQTTVEPPVIDEAALGRAGVYPPAPAPIINDRALDPVATPSQRMGLDPSTGPMSAAAALAVDSGATSAISPAPEVVNADTGEITRPEQAPLPFEQPQQQPDETLAGMRERLAFIEQQARTNGGWDRRLIEERTRLQNAITAAGPQPEPEVPAALQPEPSPPAQTMTPDAGADQNPIKNGSDAPQAAGARWDSMDANARAAVLARQGGWATKSGFLNVVGKNLMGRGWEAVPEKARARIERLIAQDEEGQDGAIAVARNDASVPAASNTEAGADVGRGAGDTVPQRNVPTVGGLDPAATATAGSREPAESAGDADNGRATVTPASIAGKRISREWTAFSQTSGTLSIPRAEMPQIKAEHRGAMVNFMNARGVTHEQATMDAGDLKPTQAEFSPAKVARAKRFDGGDRSILVSSDGYVLDGHHQWLAKREAGEQIKVIRLNAPIRDLVTLAREFPSSTNASGASSLPAQSVSPTKPKAAVARKSRAAADAYAQRWFEMTLAEREALALSIGQPGIFALKTAQKRWDRLLEKVRESLAAKMSQTEGKPEIDTAKDQATNSDAQTRQKGPEQAADIDSRALAAAIAPQATELDLRAKSHEVERDGDVGVVMGSGDVRFVSLAEAAAATRSEIDGGTPATPFQIHNATGIRIGDAQRAIDAANKTKASEIADFGEKLGGARKDRDAMRAAFDKVPTDAEIEHLPLSKLWPASETDKIEDPFTAAVMFASRAEIPAKPRKGYKVRAWAEKVKLFRGVVQRALGDVTREQFLAEMRSHRALDGFRAKLALLEAIDRQHWKRIGEVNEYPDAYRFGEDGEKIRSSFVSVTIDGRAEHFSGVGSVADALDAVRERLGDGPAESRLQFDVYSKGGAYFIAKAGDKEKRALRRFPSAKEAMEYRKSNHDDLVAAWEAVKDRDNVKKTDVRRGENRERVGHDWRGGKDVTPEQFIEELGFRGVEFGNWVEQGKGAKERQGMLNQAYDALRDLADVVGIPPRAVSLDGTLGLGFGSRGSGRASAHFESDTLVINLTKTRGAGSLAHEWFHALDNYFARYRGVPTFKGNQAQYRREAFITYNPESFYTHKTTGTILPQRAFEVMIKGERHPEHGRLSSRAMDRAQWELKEGVRPEVGEAFSGVVKALDESPMAQRSALNDKGATDGYWSRIIERAARAFEGYAIHKMAQRGHQNDYLANVVPAADFVRDAGRYPYMLESEMAPVAEAFDALFATIQTRRTDRGEALFSFAGRDAETADLHGLGNAQRRIAAGENPEAVRQATGWHRGADGMWRFEISDEQARLAVGGKTAAEVLDAASLDGPNVRVADMLDHPQLFAAYPHLENIRVELMPAGERAAARLMRSVTGTRLQIRGSLKSETLPSVMLHELQHAIQNAEGFATGGSARNLTSDLDRSGAETYRRLAGEVEARNTQSRMRMTDAMRRQVSPELTADVPSDEVIVTFNGQVLSTAPKNTGSRLPVSERGLLRALRYQFPGLVEPTRRMLERGRAGTKGGLVVIDSADPLRVAGTFSMKTGRALDDSIELFSEAATVNGFFDPRSGLIFLVGPNLDPITAPAVLLHEMIHGQQREKIDAQAMAMLMNRSQEKDASTRAFLDRVAQRMVDAGAAADSKEAAAYIVEQAVIEGRSRGYRVADSKFLDWVGVTLGPRVAEFVRSVAAMVRTWMIRHGGITTLTVDDLVGYAMAGVERAASGRAGAGRNAVPATSIGPDGMAGAIRAVIDAARSPGHAPQKANLGGVADWLADEAKARAGLNIAGFTHVLDGSAVRHMLNRHTNPTIEKNRGQIPLTDADIAAAAEVIAEPDQVVLGTKTQGRKDQIAYLKRQADGSILYLEEVRSGRRELAAVSMRKYPAAKDFSDIVATLPSNARSDGGDGLIVVSPPGGGNIQFSRAGVTSQQIARNIGDGLKSITVQNIRQAGRHKLTDWLKLGLQFLGRRQLVEVYGDVLPLAHYDRLAAQMEADKNDVGATADDLARRWGKLPDEQRLAELMHDATLAQVDADSAVPYVAGDDRMRSTMLKGQFKALSADAQKVYREARDHYRRHHAEVRDAIRDRIGRSELKNERKAEILKRMDDDFFKAVKGVYFPLARFGQYVVVVKDAAGKVESVSRAETMLEAEAMRREMVKAFPARDGYRVGRVVLSKEFVASRDMVGRGFMTELYEALDQQNLPAAQLAELEDTLGQLYLSSLPDLSWAKHGIHRKGTPGFSQDARRAFAQNTFHGARYLAKLRYGDQMQTELDRMQKHVDEMSSADGFDQPGAQRVVDEMNKRHDAMMNPKSNPLSTALTSLGFVYYLGLSPAAAAVNLSQTALVAYPVMGAKWGFKKAGAALLKASGETLAGKNDMRSQLTDADEIRAYDEAVRTGTIDVTMAHDLAGIAQGEDAKVMWKIRPVMRMASFLFHHAERFNRQATFIAAYRLAKEAGSHHDSAYEQAVKATYDGHFDYSAGNRPRVMQGNVARVVLLFKQYAQNMIFTLARNAYQSVAGESDEVKREARKVFGALLTTHAAAAGVLGLPFVGTLLTMASAIGGSDDEPWDAEAALRNMLAETFGPTVSEVISKGFSRLTPWDISGRVGLNNLLLPDVQESLEGQRWAESFATAMLGPVIGMGANAAKGAQKMADGDYGRGLEDMLPIFMRNPIKAYRLWDEGAIDRSGIAIKDEVSTAGALGQLAGFSPSEVRLAFEGRSAVFRADRRLAERRAELMSGFARAAMDKDAEAMAQARDAIAAFNQANPGRRITAPQMWQSVRARQRRIDQAQDGVYLPRNRRDALEAGRFANP